jgi:AcrR family transcriptional regulator
VASPTRRLGRPPASSSAETRGRIVDTARRCFADQGYEATTNRQVAEAAGITSGAIYYYFDSKLDIYRAVLAEVQERVYHLFTAAERGADTFVAKLEAVYEAAHDLNRSDASLARFLGASRIDRRRVAEVAEAVGPHDRRSTTFFEAIVDHGIETGEIGPEDRAAVLGLIRAFNIGLTDGLSGDQAEHREAIDGFMLVVRGYVRSPRRAD